MYAAFAVHSDFRSHSGGLLKIGMASGAVISSSLKQKINTRSSTESELIAVDDMISKICWTHNFLHEKGIPVKESILFQDNQSAILLQKKGFEIVGKRIRPLNIRYFL